MSRNTRRSKRRAASILRSNRKSWFRRYLKALSTGVAAASIGTAGLLSQPAHAATDTWVGNTSNLWNVPANWSALPVTGDSLQFGAAGTAGLTLSDNLMTAASFNIAGVTFTSAAGAYVINPATAGTNGFTLTGDITSNSTNVETINDDMVTTLGRTVTTVPGGSVVLGGSLSGTGGGLSLSGGGNLTLAGAVNYTGTTTVNAGTLNLTGTMGATTGVGPIIVGPAPGTSPVLKIGGNITTGATANIVVGGTVAGNTSGANAVGAIYQTAGNFISNIPGSIAAFQLGAANNAYGYYNMSGGSVTFNEIGIGGGNVANTGATGVVDISGGTFTSTAWITVGRGISQVGVMNVTGGTVVTGTPGGGEFGLNWGGAGSRAQLSITNGTVDTTGTRIVLNEAGSAAGDQITNININAGGVLRTNRVRAFAEIGGFGFLNFNGGTLRASGIPAGQPFISQNANDYISGAFATYIYSGGATIDNAGFNTGTIPAPFLSPAGSGVNSIGLIDGGAGYIGAPAVVLAGGNGLGATAVANINPATGKVTGITVTNRGSGYASGDVLTATLVGGGATTPATIGAISLNTNTSGGVTFTGSGTTTLASASTYTGPTLVTGGGTLRLGQPDAAAPNSVNGDINLSSGITLGTAGSAGNLVQASGVAVSTGVTLVNGTVGGTGTINNLIVNSGAANAVISNNTGGTTPLTVGSLTFSGTGILNLTTSAASASNPVLVTTTLTASGPANSVTINASNTGGGWGSGTYQLASLTGSLGGTGLPAYKAVLAGLGARQTSNLTNPAGLLNVVVAGDSAIWTGKLNSDWTTTVQASPKNWALSTSLAATDYVSGDAVVFDDTATGSTNINISTANVTPALVTLNNTTKNYTIGSTGGFVISGTGSMLLNGTGTVTLNSANTFSGGVTVNSGGTLNLGAPATVTSSAIGTGRLTIGQNVTIDNTSGAAVTLGANNPLTLNGDFTFTGTKDLNLGTGATTVNANAGNVNAGTTTVNTPAAGSTLTIGGVLSQGNGLTKVGLGTLALGGGGTITGVARVNNGVLKITGGALNIAGTGPTIGSGFLSGTNASVIITGGTVTIPGETWLASDLNSYGAFTVQGGTTTENGIFAMSRQTGANGGVCGVSVLNVTGGTFNVANNVAGGSFGNGGAASGALALMNVSGTGAFNTTGNNGIFVGGGAYPGFLNVSGNGTTQGTVTVGATTTDSMVVGLGGAAPGSYVNLGAIGGTTTSNGRITSARVIGGAAAGTLFNFHGGTLRASANDGVIVNGQTAGSVFMTGFSNAYIYGEGAVVDTQGNTDTISQALKAPTGQGVAATGAGLVAGLTVSGTGFIDTPYVQVTGGDGTGASAVAVIDYTTGNLTGIRLTNPGVGYTVAPTFTLVGGGTGATSTITGAATLAANVGGSLTKLGTGTLALSGNNTFTGGTFVNAGLLGINSATALGTGALTIGAAGAGINNTSGAPVTNASPENWNFDLVYGGTRNLTLSGLISLGPNAGATRTITANGTQTLTVSGVISNGTNATTPTTALTKAGAGNFALSGVEAYTGATTVTAGTLSLTGAGNINASSGITVNGATAKFVQSSSVAVSTPVTVTLGTLDGTTTVNTATIANAAGAGIAHGAGTLSPLTIGSLTYSGAGSLNFTTSPATASTAKFQTTTLATNAAGKVNVNGTNTLGIWAPGTFAIASYTGAIGGAGFSGFQVGTFSSLGARQSATLDNATAGLINVIIGGDRAIWTGAGDGNWDTAAHTPKNWKLSSNNAPTDFVTNDATLFDDTATGTTTVNLTANVATANMSFNNSSKNYTIQSGGTFGITSGVVFKDGTGALTLNNANTYAGGTNLNTGTLNINNAAAIGTGALTISGGTLDNTSGGPLTMTNRNAENWNGDFAFTGTSDLKFTAGDAAATPQVVNNGLGAVTLGGTGAARTVTVNGANLIVGPINGTPGLTKAGTGTLVIDSTTGTANAQQSTIGGTLNVTGGKVQIGLPNAATASDLNVGGLTGSGTIENSSNNNRSVNVTNATDNVFSGILQDGAGTGLLGLTKAGAGKLTLSGTSTFSRGLTVSSGEVVLTGTITPQAAGAASGVNNVSGNTGPTPILTLTNGSTLNSPRSTAPSIQMGTGAAMGVLRMQPGSTLNSASELWLADADGRYGAMDMTGGTANIGSWLALGRGGGQGVVNQSGGSVTVLTNQLTIGSFGGTTDPSIEHGLYNISGGTVTTTNNVYVGEQSQASLNVTSTGRVVAGIAVRVGLTANGANSNLNLLGGTVNTPFVGGGTGGGAINFNGGVLQAATDTADFITQSGTGPLTAYAYPGNAVIDSNGHQVFLNYPISAPTGNGVSAAGLTVSGGGYASTPFVNISGGGGKGAKAVAVIDANGNLTGIQITNPGVNYTSAPTFALFGGGIGATGAINGTPALVANVSGGLTKIGSGSLTVSGLSTYTGPTTVKQGVLSVGVAGAVPLASTVVVAGGTFATGGIANQFGPLQVADNSGIDLGFGSGVYQFANSTSVPWSASKTVSILNWSGSPNSTSGSDHLVFDTAGLTAAQRAAVHFAGFNGAAFIGNELVPQSVSTRKLGDVTGDNHVNSADITAMLQLLTDIPGYRASHSLSIDDMLNSADIDSSGSVTNADIQNLIQYLQNGNGSVAPVPEPGTLVLLVCGTIPGVWLARSWRKNKGDAA